MNFLVVGYYHKIGYVSHSACFLTNWFSTPAHFFWLLGNSRQSGISISVIRSITKPDGQLTVFSAPQTDQIGSDGMGSYGSHHHAKRLVLLSNDCIFDICDTQIFHQCQQGIVWRTERQRGWSSILQPQSRTPRLLSPPDSRLLTQLTDSIGRPIVVDFSTSDQSQAKVGPMQNRMQRVHLHRHKIIWDRDPGPTKRSFLVFLCLKFMYPHNGVTKQLEELNA